MFKERELACLRPKQLKKVNLYAIIQELLCKNLYI